MPGFHPQQFLRVATGLKRDLAQIAKALVASVLQNLVELSLSEALLPMLGGRDLQTADRIDFDVALSARPSHAPLDRPQIAPARCPRQNGIQIDPLLHMKRLDVRELQLVASLAEPLDSVAIPFVGIRRPMLLDPL